MNELSTNTYKFGGFFFDAGKLALYYQEQLVKSSGEKSLQVLAVLLENANALASHDEIIESVWSDNCSGVTPVHTAQYIKQLRKILKKYEPKNKYIENIKGRGYMFVGEIESGESESREAETIPQTDMFPAENEKFDNASKRKNSQLWNFTKSGYVLVGSIIILAVCVLAWNMSAADDEREIRRVVEDSQKFESLVLYKNPSGFKESQLRKYWMPETKFNSDFDIVKVRAGVQRLLDEGRYYGKETRPERFEFQYVDINKEKNFAVVKTLEEWFIVEYLTNGTLHKTKTVGPYFVSYILQKVGGQWLIERSNTARANPASNK